MEQLIVSAKGSTANLFSDPSHRMDKRPPPIKSGEGLGFQELGSTFGPRTVVAYGKPSKSKLKPAPKPPPNRRRSPPRMSADESDDELLLSSQRSTASDATSSPKRVAKEKKRNVSPGVVETVQVDGRLLNAHPEFRPSSLNKLKGLRFTKTKKSPPVVDTVTEVPPPSSSLTDSQDLFKPISDNIEVIDGPPRGLSSSLHKPPETFSTRRPSLSATRAANHQFPHASTSKPSPTINDTPRALAKPPRPRPRVVITTNSRKTYSPESTPRPMGQKRDLPLRNRSPELLANVDKKRAVKKSAPPSSRREPQEFPMSLQAKENVSDGAWSGDASSSKAKKVPRAAAPKPIPLPSPLGSQAKPITRETTFPNLSPLSSSNNKGKTRAKTLDEDDIYSTDDVKKRRGPKPFPMSSEMLVGINRRSKSPVIRSVKRASSDDGGDERIHEAKKKRKDTRSGILNTPDYLYEPMEEDSIDLGHTRDPSKMCPYCDEDLPPHPTPLLQHLLATARKKSVSDPRPRNRGGLKAPLTIYISVCQRHRFELHQLPIAAEKGWPKTIDFTKVPARVKKMKKALEAIVLDQDDIGDTEGLHTNNGFRGPRSKSVFWREVKKEVKKQGSRAVVGVKGQFASFEKTQPGYYGEQGSVIIHQTLFDLFPPSTIDASLIAPLSPAEFIQRILVPEAAVRLIAQDLCADIEDAIVTLRESAQYGVAMFPDTSENKRKGGGVDDDEMGVADRIVMERARVRRKELEAEEKVEEEILEEERAAQRAKARDSRREKALERARQVKATKAHAKSKVEVATSDVSEAEAEAVRRTQKERAPIGSDSESDAMSVDSLSSRQSVRVSKKGLRDDRIKRVMAVPLVTDSDSDSIELVSDPLLKTRNEKSKARERGVDTDIRVGAETIAARKIKPFGGFASLVGEELKDTPRPRVRKTNPTTAEAAAGNSAARILPLQIARNRPDANGPGTHDGWSRNLRTVIPSSCGTESDTSNKEHFDWLWSSPDRDSD